MLGAARELGLSERIQGLLNTIHEESICPDFNTKLDQLELEKLVKHNDDGKTSDTNKAKERTGKDRENKSQSERQKDMDSSEMDLKRVSSENMDRKTNSENSQQNTGSEPQQTVSKSDTDLCSKDSDTIDKPKDAEQSNCGVKRPHAEVSNEGSSFFKRPKVELNPDRRSSTSACPLLFYNVNRRKIKGVNIPK